MSELVTVIESYRFHRLPSLSFVREQKLNIKHTKHHLICVLLTSQSKGTYRLLFFSQYLTERIYYNALHLPE